MLEALLGSTNRERILLYLFFRKEGYAREIARYYNADVSQIQKQLERPENGGMLFSRPMGKTIAYRLNARYPFTGVPTRDTAQLNSNNYSDNLIGYHSNRY